MSGQDGNLRIAIRRITKLVLIAAAILLAAGAALIAFPQPLFSHMLVREPFTVWSDRPIDPAIADVLDDAARRLRSSELHDPGATFRLFICNEPWRLRLLARNASIGGSADTLFTRNIYLRQADPRSNKLIPPHGTLADAEVRTLAYYVAHEATHVMQSRAFGRLLLLWYPRWLIEGHADLVAKAGAFDADENLRLLLRDDPRLDYERSGLYRRYHLMVATLAVRDGMTVRELFADPPAETVVLQSLRNPPSR
jgi:hypothetical protein